MRTFIALILVGASLLQARAEPTLVGDCVLIYNTAKLGEDFGKLPCGGAYQAAAMPQLVAGVHALCTHSVFSSAIVL